MPRSPRSFPATPAKPARPPWRLEEAKARFSEVVRRARTEGPQHVTVRGQAAVVVIAVEELRRLQPSTEPALPLLAFLQGLELDGLDLEREPDPGRDVTW